MKEGFTFALITMLTRGQLAAWIIMHLAHHRRVQNMDMAEYLNV